MDFVDAAMGGAARISPQLRQEGRTEPRRHSATPTPRSTKGVWCIVPWLTAITRDSPCAWTS